MPRRANIRCRAGGAPFLSFFIVALLGVAAGTLLGGRFAPLKEEGDADAGALVSQTFRDVFGEGERKPVLEIDLDAPRGASPADAPRAEKNEESILAPAATSSSERSGDDRNSPVIAPCEFSSAITPRRAVLLSEIAWMGTASSASDEWIELGNNSSEEISLYGWRLVSDDGDFEVTFAEDERIAPAEFYLLERTDDSSLPGIRADKVYRGALANGGMRLQLLDDRCELVDEVDARSGWPGGDNSEKRTLERNPSDFSWGTSAEKGGTPKRERNVSDLVATTTASSLSRFRVNVSRGGSGYGTITSDPGGVQCGFDCDEFYDARTFVTLTATPSADSTFESWSGACSGNATCTLTVTTDISVIATFASVFQSPASPSSPSASIHPFLSEVFYDAEGSDTGKEFVELYNPGQNVVVLDGWSLLSGTSSLAKLGSKSEDVVTIGARGFLLIGLNGYTGTPRADVTRTSSLPNTSATISLNDTNGATVDSMTYSNSAAPGQSLVRKSWESNEFTVQITPNPQNSTGN